MVCNRSIFENYDKEFVDDCIWIDKKKFVSSFLYRIKLLKQIKKREFSEMVYCSYSREFLVDSIALVGRASMKIAFETNLSNLNFMQKRISDTYYDKLFQLTDKPLFEFDINKIFISLLLEQDIDACVPELISNNVLNHPSFVEGRYVVLFIEASNSSKEWEVKNFLEVGNYLQKYFNYEILVCGVKKRNFNFISNKFIDLTGKTTLMELTELISGAELLVSNDTGAMHIGLALNIKTVCISKGDQFGRFNPYPKTLSENGRFIFPSEIKDNIKSRILYERGSALNINDIKSTKVIELLGEFIDKN